MTSPSCTDLRVEDLTAPGAIGTDRPRFTWIVDHVTTGYELEIRDTHGTLLWHSAHTGPDAPTAVVYGGPVLHSDTDYTWQVRSREDNDRWTEWAVAGFGTGLLHPTDWQAAWVEPAQMNALVERWSIVDWLQGAGPDTPAEQRLRPVNLLRHRFEVGEEVVRARLHATSRGVYTAWLNDDRVGDEILAPGFDSYQHRIATQSYDVTGQLNPGQNLLAVALADGWWAGRIGLTGSSAQFGTRTAAIWQLHLTYADGHTDTILSGPDVRSSTGGWNYAELVVGESFDRRTEPAGWRTPDVDDTDWTPVTVADYDRSVLVPATGEPVRRILHLPPVSVTETTDGAVVDFGQVIAGRVRLRLPDSTPGQTITIDHTETLDADGGWFPNITGINKEQRDVFTAAGGADEWEPEFTFHGFRYARIHGHTGPLDPADVTAVVLASDLEQTGSFTSSDERLNQLHRNVVWSQRGNFLSIPTDCPQRERAGWTGDVQVFTPAATNNARVAPFLTRWLKNLRADQRPDGSIPNISPWSPFDETATRQAEGIPGITAAAGWGDAIAFVPWTLYERYGDPRVLEDNYSAVQRWIAYQQHTARTRLPDSLTDTSLSADRRARQAFLYNGGVHFGDWLAPSTLEGVSFADGISVAPRLTSEYIAPMFQAQTLTIAARMAQALDRPDDAAHHDADAAQVRAAFAAEYLDPDGHLPVALQGLYVLALAFDMVPENLRPATAAHLAVLVRDRGNRLDTGFLSVPYLLDVLWDTGYHDLAHQVLWQSESPSWLYAVDHGATTIWETWAAVGPDGTPQPVSLNHYAFGCVDDFLYRRIAGLQPTAPGWKSVLLAPDLYSELTDASAHINTPAGTLGIRWSIEGDRALIETEIPHNIHAQLLVDDAYVDLAPGRSRHEIPIARDTQPRSPRDVSPAAAGPPVEEVPR